MMKGTSDIKSSTFFSSTFYLTDDEGRPKKNYTQNIRCSHPELYITIGPVQYTVPRLD